MVQLIIILLTRVDCIYIYNPYLGKIRLALEPVDKKFWPTSEIKYIQLSCGELGKFLYGSIIELPVEVTLEIPSKNDKGIIRMISSRVKEENSTRVKMLTYTWDNEKEKKIITNENIMAYKYVRIHKLVGSQGFIW